ncbi:GNAT family N-acetyltransferase [Phormidium sp. CLA17]|uniref:GNAT family N-acetyltransferase n=1 Tax=Leptolyngbya sp. Cla-17 TaxID=2803751 RepID=UPI0018515487|nr:GNAT family N-acetyltransferase [Leptolyngbya sp. Cla-17]MBM0740714.1 GNAT family N-acetyltransferase [Leptolyngbya sp. Cla-17]
MTALPGFTIRAAEESDRAQFINLARLAFMPTRSQADVEKEMQAEPLNPPGGQGWVLADQAGNLAGRYRHLELALFFQGVQFSMAGVAGVAVAPERRGQKIAQGLIEHTLQRFHEQQIPLSMLYPFQHGFYRKLGWAWVGDTRQYRVSARHIPLYSERVNVMTYRDDLQASIKAVYQEAAQQHNGWLQREPNRWKGYFEPEAGQEIYVYAEAGTLLGYMVIEFTHLEPTKTQWAIVVQEWVALTAAAYRGLIGFLASLRDQVTTIVWNTDPKDPFPHLISEQRCDPAIPTLPFEFGLTHRFGATGGGFMWRLVDVMKALELRPINPGVPFAIAFNIIDPVFGEQQISVDFVEQKMCPTQQPAATSITISVEHLTQLFCGMRSASELQWLGAIEIEGDSTLLPKLDAAWQATPPFCWDFF